MGKAFALLSVTLFLFASCPQQYDHSLEVYNNSNYNITIRLISKTTGEEVGWHHTVKSNNSVVLHQSPTDFWRTMIEEENGLIMQAFPGENFYSPSDSLDQMTPLKEWDIPDWAYVESVGGKFYYP